MTTDEMSAPEARRLMAPFQLAVTICIAGLFAVMLFGFGAVGVAGIVALVVRCAWLPVIA